MPKLYKKINRYYRVSLSGCCFPFYIFLFKKLVDGRNRREEAGTKYLEREKNRNLVYDKE